MKRAATRAVATSKRTSNAQTIVPREIRDRLGLRLSGRLRDHVTKAGIPIDERPEPEDDPFVEFVEWAGSEDEGAFKSS